MRVPTSQSLVVTTLETNVLYRFFLGFWHETRNFGSGSYRRFGRHRAGLASRRRHHGGSTGKVGKLSSKLATGTSVRLRLYYCAGESRRGIKGSGRRPLDRN